MSVRFTTFRKINKNRFRKIYPINHFSAVDGYLTDKQLIVETKLVNFVSSHIETVILDGNYPAVPVIIGTAFSESSNSLANVNVFIGNVVLVSGKIHVDVQTSDTFTGTVALQVMEVA